ncbi:MAG TPA: YbhB/YbcL family Raf kinase inhibitor-like protein [Terriglobales bacterium]|nr:YbhB/YbcL family Raf kinase inhibitor-like protein [Terriglobales bacterium]
MRILNAKPFAALLCAASLAALAYSMDPLVLRSPAFAANAPIPARFSCDGDNASPPLQWSDLPPRTVSLALILSDPDAPHGTFFHWLIWNLPPQGADGLPPAQDPQPRLANGAVQGTNDFRRLGYGGPCPPPGPAHHYVFTLYALDAKLALPAGATHGELEAAMRGHVLATARLVGTFARGQ